MTEVIEVEGEVAVVEVDETAVEVIEVGTPGPAGQDGADDAYYVHVQGAASDVWTINHNLGKRPAIQAFDSADRPALGVVEHVSDVQALIHMSHAFGGVAYCN